MKRLNIRIQIDGSLTAETKDTDPLIKEERIGGK